MCDTQIYFRGGGGGGGGGDIPPPPSLYDTMVATIGTQGLLKMLMLHSLVPRPRTRLYVYSGSIISIPIQLPFSGSARSQVS